MKKSSSLSQFKKGIKDANSFVSSFKDKTPKTKDEEMPEREKHRVDKRLFEIQEISVGSFKIKTLMVPTDPGLRDIFFGCFTNCTFTDIIIFFIYRVIPSRSGPSRVKSEVLLIDEKNKLLLGGGYLPEVEESLNASSDITVKIFPEEVRVAYKRVERLANEKAKFVNKYRNSEFLVANSALFSALAIFIFKAWHLIRDYYVKNETEHEKTNFHQLLNRLFMVIAFYFALFEKMAKTNRVNAWESLHEVADLIDDVGYPYAGGGPPAMPITLPKGYKEIDVPGNGDCLFWAAAFGLLLPLLEDKEKFKIMYKRLFNGEEVSTEEDNEKIERVRHILIAYEKDPAKNEPYDSDEMYNLVCRVFRKKVADTLNKVIKEGDRKAVAADAKKESWEAYVEDMRKPGTWGGQPEILAISLLAKKDIEVHSLGHQPLKFYTKDGESGVLSLIHVNANNDSFGQKNHYHFAYSSIKQNIQNQNKEKV